MPMPCYPEFTPLDISLKDVLHPRLSLTYDGVSEFTFSSLYVFRNKYKYRISRLFGENGSDEEGSFIISGEHFQGSFKPFQGNLQPLQQPEKFFMTPCRAPDWETLKALFNTHDFWKNIPESVLNPVRETLEKRGVVFTEDRDNFDYLYHRKDLAELSGKKFHKKKNHFNHFVHSFPDHEQKPMNAAVVPAAIEVLERWKNDRAHIGDSGGDYKAAREALEMFDSLALRGSVFFAEGKPVAYCLGESIARGRMFAIHFEKAIEEYKGIYQYVNRAFAASLPRFFTLINREQDIGNEGIRQAKMTYRPCDFVRKYTGRLQ